MNYKNNVRSQTKTCLLNSTAQYNILRMDSLKYKRGRLQWNLITFAHNMPSGKQFKLLWFPALRTTIYVLATVQLFLHLQRVFE